MKIEQIRSGWWACSQRMSNGEIVTGFAEFRSISILRCLEAVTEWYEGNA